MPIIDRTQSTGERPIAPLPSGTTITTGQAVGDFLSTENGLFNIADGIGSLMFKRFEPDPSYTPESDMVGYEGYADDLRGAASRQEMTYLKNKIDKETKARETFAVADGWQKAAAIGSLIATDPLTMVPIGTTAYKTYRTGGRILEGAAKTAGIGMAMETANEAILQANQVTRTAEESLYNIAASTVVSGILGGAAGGLSKVEFDDLVRKYEQDMDISQPDLSTVGASQVGTTAAQEEIQGLKRTTKAIKALPRFLRNPVFETATSQSKTVRQLSEKMADLSLVKNKNAEFIANETSVENLVKGYEALKVPFYKSEKELYQSYMNRVKTEGLPFEQRIGSNKDGSLTRQEFNEQVWYAGINKDEHLIPEVGQLAKVARKDVFDPILKRSEEVGIFKDVDEMEVKTADSWMKRMYDVEKIKANRTEFKKIVMEDLQEGVQRNLDEIEELKLAEKTEENAKKLKALEFKVAASSDELEDIAEQLIDRVTNATAGRLPYDIKLESKSKGPQKMGVRGSAKKRVWNIRDEKIQDYLIKDVRAIVESHIRTMAPDNEIMGKFGTLDFDPIKKQIQEDYNRLRNAKVKDKKTGESRAQTNTELAKLDRQMTADIKNMEALHEKLRGIYAQPDDFAAPQHVLERGLLSFNFIRLLGDVVASSVPDLARPIMVHGFSKTYGTLIKSAMKDIKGLKMAASEMEEIGLALDITNGMTTLRRANMDEYAPVTGKVDEIMNKGSAFFALASGMNHWTAAMKTFSGVMTQNRMLEGINQFAETGQLGVKEIKNLASHGIDRNMAKDIAEQYKKYGEQRGSLRIANAREWDNAKARNALRNAVRKQVDEIIVTPGLDKPLWMSRPGWRTVGQFKSFTFSSTQRVLLAGMQQADANYFVGMSAMITLGSLVYAYKTMMAGKELSDDPRVWIAEGVDRSGVTGIAMDINNIIEKTTRGTIGVNALVGGPPMSRYASRNVTGALLGPSFGTAQDIFQVTGAVAAGEVAKSDITAMRRLIPGQNLPYIRDLFDQAEAGISSTIGAK